MYDETKIDESSRNQIRDDSLEVIKMAQNVRIKRTEWNHRRSLSERLRPRTKLVGLGEIMGENPDSSGFTPEEGSEIIEDYPKSTRTSSMSMSGQDEDGELCQLRSRYDHLQTCAFEQRNQIDELESRLEVLVEAFKQKEEEAECALRSNALCEKRLREMATLKSEKWKLTVEVDTLRQVIQEQSETLQATRMGEPLPASRSSTHLVMNLMNDTSEADVHIEALRQKINELSRIVKEKDNAIKDLKEVLHSKDLGLMEIERTIDETCRRHTNVEDELNAKSHEMDALRHRASILQDTVENRNHELQAMEQELEAEKEATRIVQVEKERVLKKYEALAKEKSSKDKTFMHLYDELAPVPSLRYSEVDSEFKDSEGCEATYTDYGSEGYCHLEFNRDTRRRSRKSKPTRLPPPVPSPSLKSINSGKTKGDIESPKDDESDETKRLNQADYEYFLMSSIAVRMNLATQYKKDEIMAVDLGKMWEVCRNSQIPMNKYYLYIEDALRAEFNLPEFPHPHVEQRPINANCCLVM